MTVICLYVNDNKRNKNIINNIDNNVNIYCNGTNTSGNNGNTGGHTVGNYSTGGNVISSK